ncbi:MAG: hypothetical protein PHV37_08060 [Candidatus Gastranaerophilales bacterium]|nr:hypothetical protein [Candidatus Gastranaerophilales bacterium]
MERKDKIKNLIDALGAHQDSQAVAVLDEIGTNCADDEIREWTAKALINRNSHDSLKIMLLAKGKGVNDLSARVAMTAINELLALEDKTEAIKILDDTIEQHSDKEVKDTARSVRALMTFSC